MSNYKLLLSDDINCQNIYNYLCENLKHKETLFLTVTQNLKRLRLQNQTFENNDKINIKTFSELKENVYDQIRDKGRFISRADQKFILKQVIRQLFSGERQIAFYKIRNDLFELELDISTPSHSLSFRSAIALRNLWDPSLRSGWQVD